MISKLSNSQIESGFFSLESPHDAFGQDISIWDGPDRFVPDFRDIELDQDLDLDPVEDTLGTFAATLKSGSKSNHDLDKAGDLDALSEAELPLYKDFELPRAKLLDDGLI